MTNLTYEGKATIFKSLKISEITHLASVAVSPNSTITQLNKRLKEFTWNHKRPKIKEKALINNFDKDCLKNVNIPPKITSLKCSWVKRLSDKNFHELKMVPLFLIEKYFAKNFKFHGFLDIPNTLLKKCQNFTEIFC